MPSSSSTWIWATEGGPGSWIVPVVRVPWSPWPAGMAWRLWRWIRSMPSPALKSSSAAWRISISPWSALPRATPLEPTLIW